MQILEKQKGSNGVPYELGSWMTNVRGGWRNGTKSSGNQVRTKMNTEKSEINEYKVMRMSVQCTHTNKAMELRVN